MATVSLLAWGLHDRVAWGSRDLAVDSGPSARIIVLASSAVQPTVVVRHRVSGVYRITRILVMLRSHREVNS